MSLINKMLQDLDARGTTRAEGVPPEIKTVSAEPRRVSPLRIAAVTAALLVAALGVAAWVVLPLEGDSYKAQPLPPAAPAPLAPVTPPATPPVAAGQARVAAPAPHAEPEPEPAPAPAPEPAPPTAAPAPAVAAARASRPAVPAAAGKEAARAGPAPRMAEMDEIADADARAAASTTSWAVASERARAERERLARRWKAEDSRLAALAPSERREGERKLREEQARAAARARYDDAWLAALQRKEAAGGNVAVDAAPTPAQQARGPGRVETSGQGAENAYRRALASLQDGRAGEAIAGLQQTLRLNPRHEAARQTLVSLLVENNRGDEAMIQLGQALALDPRQPALAMLLARLQIERGKSGIEALQRTLPHAAGNGEYHAFLGGALQRHGRLREAAEQYETALRTAPDNAVWWMGLGIALHGDKRHAEAGDAFRQAKALGTLSPELHAFVERRLQQLAR
ncbi:tetratricopeptide repeat protein [Massilia jejuensis]|uniref:Tetratricopeptide repeat protein n=1 Tax=Massilia jejuensis TaxID=648894 RepID=A0ABW0PCW2_9BURK